MSAGVYRKVDGFALNLRCGPLLRGVWYGQVEARRSQIEATKVEHFASALEYRTTWFDEGDPKRNQPTIPEMRAGPLVSYSPRSASKGRHENGSVSTAELEGDIESLISQSAKNLPLPTKRAFVWRHFDCPGAIHTDRKSVV